jgi:hypothetical protein
MSGKIIDCFSYFNEKELLELRIKLLYDCVDKFLITDANYTHSGNPKSFSCREEIKKLGLESDKVQVIELDLSDDKILNPDDYDKFWGGSEIKFRSRERLQRDGILNVLNEYDDNDVFIVSDCDEIINPETINFLSEILRYQYDNVFKIPLVLLEGRADLRTYCASDNSEKPWNKSMYMCLKHHLQKCFPTQIRAEYYLPFGITYATQNNQILTDLGWHFSWMGDSINRMLKAKSFCHYSDNLVESMKYYEPKEDSISPESLYFNNKDYILKKYLIKNLPQLIFDLPKVKNFLLPNDGTN